MSSEPGKILIVNADDLGRTPGINSGIFEAYRNGLVTSATLMVGFAAAEDAAAELASHPDLGIGLHVALTGSPSVLPPDRLPSLMDERGHLPRGPDGLLGADPKEVMAEVEAQFQRFLDLTGGLPTHLDSHHHSHRNPVVCDALTKLAHEHDLPIRRSSPEIGERLLQEGIPTTDSFIEEFFGDEARLDVLVGILGGLQDGTTEIMCHPAHVDDELRESSTYAEDRARELEVLTHPDVATAVQELGLTPAHFGTAW